MDLGGRVRAERERPGLSREELIGMMGALRMDRNTLWHIEAGSTKNPRADQIIALAKALGVSADYLLGLTDTPTPPPAAAADGTGGDGRGGFPWLSPACRSAWTC